MRQIATIATNAFMELIRQPIFLLLMTTSAIFVVYLASIHLAPEKFELRTQDVFTVLGQLVAEGREFDLIMADPPFGEKNIGRRSTSLSQQLLDDARLPQLLAVDGLFVLGHTKRDTLSLPSHWSEVKVMKHGDSMMRFLSKLVVSSREMPPA